VRHMGRMKGVVERPNQIESLHMLRGLACLLVILCHTQGTEFGQTGVDFFLVISGFMMMLSTDKVGGVHHYWIKRIKRIIPLYYSVTLFTTILVMLFPFLFHSYEISVEYVTKSLLFIPYYHNGIPGPVMELGWTLNYEMFFYLIFYISSLISFKYRGIITCIVLVTYSGIGKMISLPLILKYWSDPVILEFCFGIVTYYLWKSGLEKNRRQLKKGPLSVVILVLLIVSSAAMDFLMNYNSRDRGLIVGGIAFVVVLFLAIFDKQIYKIEILSKIGKDSYQLYLLHPFIVRAIDLVLGIFFRHNLITAIINLIISTVILEMSIYLWRKGCAFIGSKICNRQSFL